MKGLNKLALATAVAAAPFATQAMEAMNDSQMGDVTGQAGVTIELSADVGIDAIEYDQSTADEATGSFLISNVDVGGFIDPATGERDSLDLTIDIDLIGDGGFNTQLEDDGTTPTPGKVVGRELNQGDALIRLGSPVAGEAVSFGMGIDEMGLRTNVGDGDLGTEGNALLMSDMEVAVSLTQLDIIAFADEIEGFNDNSDLTADGVNTGAIGFDVGFVLQNFSADFDVAAVSVANVQMAGVGSLDAMRDPTIGALVPGENNVTPAAVSLNIGAGDTLEGFEGGPTDTDVLRIQLAEFNADMYMPGVQVGGGNVGNVALSGLDVTADMAIYGRE